MKKYFIPHADNDYRPHILRPRTIVFVCLVAVVAEAALARTEKSGLAGKTAPISHSLFAIDEAARPAMRLGLTRVRRGLEVTGRAAPNAC